MTPSTGRSCFCRAGSQLCRRRGGGLLGGCRCGSWRGAGRLKHKLAGVAGEYGNVSYRDYIGIILPTSKIKEFRVEALGNGVQHLESMSRFLKQKQKNTQGIARPKMQMLPPKKDASGPKPCITAGHVCVDESRYILPCVLLRRVRRQGAV